MRELVILSAPLNTFNRHRTILPVMPPVSSVSMDFWNKGKKSGLGSVVATFWLRLHRLTKFDKTRGRQARSSCNGFQNGFRPRAERARAKPVFFWGRGGQTSPSRRAFHSQGFSCPAPISTRQFAFSTCVPHSQILRHSLRTASLLVRPQSRVFSKLEDRK